MSKHLLPLLLLLGYCSTAISQNPLYASQDSALARFRDQYPQENVFLQTDKQTYAAGETIWFKTWCTSDGQPTFLSRIIYVEVVDQQGKVLIKQMHKLDSLGSASGDLYIPNSVSSGTFSINTYTLWMKNFPPFVGKKDILIYGTDYADKKKTQGTTRQTVSLQFFPEGGDLVTGVASRVAFRAFDENGLPVEAKGLVKDEAGNKVVDFTTEHAGMGIMELTPVAGHTYTAYVNNADNLSQYSFKLPKAKEEGLTLRIENANPKKLFILLNRGEKSKQLYGKVKVVAEMNYHVVFAALLNLDEDQMAATINKTDLPGGIIHITAFTENDRPIAERLAFIDNYEWATPALAASTVRTKARERNEITFSLPAEITQPVSLSCVVKSEAFENTATEDNIVSNSLLTGDLAGSIYQPGYYFKDHEAETLHHLDLLMMTQGWRRFEWKKILTNEYPALNYPVESSISFRGTLYKSDRKEPVKDGFVSFIIKGEDSTSIMGEARTTDKGEFLLNDINYMKKASVAYMGTNKSRENLIVDVKLNPTYIDSLHQSSLSPAVNLDTARNVDAIARLLQTELSRIMADSSVKMLKGVTVSARRISKEDSLNMVYASPQFALGKGIDPTSSMYKNYFSIWQIIQASTPGVTIEGNIYDPTVSFNRFGGLGNDDGATMSTGEGDMGNTITLQENGIAYFLNEINVTKDVISGLNKDDLAYIKIYKNEGAILGASQGAIAVYTKKGTAVGRAIFDKAYTKEDHLGYAVTREFPPPIYITDPSNHDQDSRSTLFWSGHLIKTREGNYKFAFYNNDLGKSVRLTIQGIDKAGQLIFLQKAIE